MYSRLSVPLTNEEREALTAKAQQERRDPRDQAALEIRHALEVAGFLLPTSPKFDIGNPAQA